MNRCSGMSASDRGQQPSQFSNACDSSFVVIGARNHIEYSATGLDVGVEKLRDLLGCPIVRIALERLERHLVEALHSLGQRPARRFPGRAEAAPDIDRVFEAVRIPVSTTGMLTDLFDHRVEPAGRDPDSQPAVTE